MKNVNQIIKDVDVSGKLLELCPPRPSRMDDAEYLVWLYECVCLNVSMGIGGAEHCGDYGGLRREIADLIKESWTGECEKMIKVKVTIDKEELEFEFERFWQVKYFIIITNWLVKIDRWWWKLKAG